MTVNDFNHAEIAHKVQEITILRPGSVERFRAHANQFYTEWQTYFEQKYKDIPATISDEEFDALRNDPQKMIADDTPDEPELKISLSEQYAALAVLHDTELSQYPAILEEKPPIFRQMFGQITGKNAYLRSYDDRFWEIALKAVEKDLEAELNLGKGGTEKKEILGIKPGIFGVTIDVKEIWRQRIKIVKWIGQFNKK